MLWLNGTYSGEQRDGKPHGFGSLQTDDFHYIGEFSEGLFCGKGKQEWSNGREYDGEYVNGLPNGKGTSREVDGIFQGEWLDGVMHGHGIYTWSDGHKFVGTYDRGIINGHGSYRKPSGDFYEGEFVQGCWHGHGRYTWADGRMYIGEWSNNRPHTAGGMEYSGGKWFKVQVPIFRFMKLSKMLLLLIYDACGTVCQRAAADKSLGQVKGSR